MLLPKETNVELSPLGMVVIVLSATKDVASLVAGAGHDPGEAPPAAQAPDAEQQQSVKYVAAEEKQQLDMIQEMPHQRQRLQLLYQQDQRQADEDEAGHHLPRTIPGTYVDVSRSGP